MDFGKLLGAFMKSKADIGEYKPKAKWAFTEGKSKKKK